MDVRVAALHCLDVLDDRAQAPAVAACADDVDRRIRGQARELLAKWSFETSHSGDSVSDKSLPLLDRLLAGAAKAEADDFILSSGSKPTIKRHGATTPLANNVFSADQVEAILMPHLSAAQKRDLEELRDVDFSYQVKSEDLRFRANVFRQMTGLSGIFRIVKGDIPEFEKLGLPSVAAGFGDLKNGLVLVGGPTGSGKSTTLAGIIDYINRTQARHIVTLEDPIEVIHRHKKGMINQREIGTHARSFASALRSTLREDPDVILVGEMRDLQTIQFGVTAAETGHLVFGTVHTVSADRSVDRLINAFPPAQQPQVRSMLAESLRAVLCQYLLRRRDAPGRVLAAEVMLNNDAVSNLIRKGKTFQIPSAITTGREMGMQSMDLELLRLLGLGKIYAEEAYMKAVDKSLFEAAVVKESEGKEDGAAAKPLAASPVQGARS
jgi:twitching motility protein PilT